MLADAGRYPAQLPSGARRPYGADRAAIRRAMRGLALLYHPDEAGHL